MLGVFGTQKGILELGAVENTAVTCKRQQIEEPSEWIEESCLGTTGCCAWWENIASCVFCFNSNANTIDVTETLKLEQLFFPLVELGLISKEVTAESKNQTQNGVSSEINSQNTCSLTFKITF